MEIVSSFFLILLYVCSTHTRLFLEDLSVNESWFQIPLVSFFAFDIGSSILSWMTFDDLRFPWFGFGFAWGTLKISTVFRLRARSLFFQITEWLAILQFFVVSYLAMFANCREVFNTCLKVQNWSEENNCTRSKPFAYLSGTKFISLWMIQNTTTYEKSGYSNRDCIRFG